MNLKTNQLLLSSSWLLLALELLELETLLLGLLLGPSFVPRCREKLSSSSIFPSHTRKAVLVKCWEPTSSDNTAKTKREVKLPVFFLIISLSFVMGLYCFGGGSFSSQNGTCEQKKDSNCWSWERKILALWKTGERKRRVSWQRMGPPRGKT